MALSADSKVSSVCSLILVVLAIFTFVNVIEADDAAVMQPYIHNQQHNHRIPQQQQQLQQPHIQLQKQQLQARSHDQRQLGAREIATPRNSSLPTPAAPPPASDSESWTKNRRRTADTIDESTWEQIVIRALANPKEWAQLRGALDKIDSDLKGILASSEDKTKGDTAKASTKWKFTYHRVNSLLRPSSSSSSPPHVEASNATKAATKAFAAVSVANPIKHNYGEDPQSPGGASETGQKKTISSSRNLLELEIAKMIKIQQHEHEATVFKQVPEGEKQDGGVETRRAEEHEEWARVLEKYHGSFHIDHHHHHHQHHNHQNYHRRRQDQENGVVNKDVGVTSEVRVGNGIRNSKFAGIYHSEGDNTDQKGEEASFDKVLERGAGMAESAIKISSVDASVSSPRSRFSADFRVLTGDKEEEVKEEEEMLRSKQGSMESKEGSKSNTVNRRGEEEGERRSKEAKSINRVHGGVEEDEEPRSKQGKSNRVYDDDADEEAEERHQREEVRSRRRG